MAGVRSRILVRLMAWARCRSRARVWGRAMVRVRFRVNIRAG
jgi:hypothetical protein